MTKDEVLIRAFEAVLLANRETDVQVFDDGNMHYYVGKHAVLYSYASAGKAALSDTLKLTESEQDLSTYSIKHFCAVDRIPLNEWEHGISYMPVKTAMSADPGIWVIRQVDDKYSRIGKYEYTDNTTSISGLGTCLWSIPLHIVSAIANSEYQTREFLPFLTTQASAAPEKRALLIALMGDDYCLYAPLARSSNDIPGILAEDGKEYILDGYNFELGTWENLKEKRVMSKLKPPVAAPTPIDDLPLDEPVTTEAQTVVEPEPAPEEPQPEPEPKQVTPAGPVEPPITVNEQEQPKVVRKPKAPQPFDYKAAMLYMSSDIPEDNSVDKAIEEIRALRDLQFSITRRMANLAMESMTAFKKDSEQLQAIQRLLKG